MTYDFRGQLDEFASHHSALYSGSYEEGEQKVFNTVSYYGSIKIYQNGNLSNYSIYHKDWAVNYFISNGAPPEKIVLGISAYGKSFQWNSDARMIGGPAKFGDWVSYKQVNLKFSP